MFDHDFEQKFLIEAQMLLHCGPIFFLRTRDADPLGVTNIGTFGLVDTGEKRLLVTCAHVWIEFEAMRHVTPNARMAVLAGTDRPVNVDMDPLCVDTDLDLATFDLEPILPEFSRRKFYKPQKTPFAVVKRGDPLTYLGYLGEARHASTHGVDFKYESVGITVADRSGPFICVDMMKTKRYSDVDGARIEPADSLGGISGSPVWKLEAEFSLKLVGFVTSSALGLVRIISATAVNIDGSITRPA